MRAANVLLAVAIVAIAASFAAPAAAQSAASRVVVEAIDVAEHKATSLLGQKAGANAADESTSHAIGTRFSEALARGEVDVLRNSLVKNALRKFTGKTDKPALEVLRAKAIAADKKSEWEPIIARIEKAYAGDEAATNFAVFVELVKARKPLGATSIDEVSYVLLHKAEKTPLNADERAFVLTVTRDVKGTPPALVRYEGRYMTPELKATLIKADERVAKWRAMAAKWPKGATFPWKAEVAQLRAAFKYPPGVDASMLRPVDRPDAMLRELTQMEEAAVEARDSLHRLTEEAAAARETLLDSFETSIAARRLDEFEQYSEFDVKKSVANAAYRLDDIAKKFKAWATGTEKNVRDDAKRGFDFLGFAALFNEWTAKNAQKLRNGGAVWDTAFNRVHADAIEAYYRAGCGGECGPLLTAIKRAREAMIAAEQSAGTKFWDAGHKTTRDVLVQEANNAVDAMFAKYPAFIGVEYRGLWGTTRYKVPTSTSGQVSWAATAPQWAGRDLQSTFVSSIDNWKDLRGAR